MRKRPKPTRCAFGKFARLPKRVVRGWDLIDHIAGHRPVEPAELKKRTRKPAAEHPERDETEA